MQLGGSEDLVAIVKLLPALAVCGTIAAKLALDWANGKRPRDSSDSSDGWTGDPSDDGHHGGWGGHDGDGGGGHH
jgi:hypothetical protein